MNLVELGVIKYLTTIQVPTAEICPLKLGGTERQLRVTDLMMTYYMMAAGFGTAVVVFFTELFFKIKNSSNIGPVDWQNNPGGKKTKNYDWNITRGDKNKSNFNLTPPPPYTSIYSGSTPSDPNQPTQPSSNQLQGVKRLINGRDYLVFKNKNGDSQLIPVRAPSATLFQYSYTE